MPINATSEELKELFDKISAWMDGEQKLTSVDVKNRTQNVKIKNTDKKLSYNELQMLVDNFETPFTYEQDRLDFKQLIDMQLSQLQSILTKLEQQKKPSESLIPIKGISKVMQARLRDRNIYDVKSLVAQGRTPEKRKRLAEKLDVDIKLVTTWVKQADLWRVEGMTTDMAYLLVMAGVRMVEDLARVDKNKILPILKGLCLIQIDFELDENILETLIQNAEEITEIKVKPNFGSYSSELTEKIQCLVAEMMDPSEDNPYGDIDYNKINVLIRDFINDKKDSSLGFYYNCNIEVEDEEPSHIFRDLSEEEAAELELLNGRNIKKGLDFLDDIQFKLPLPRRISGTVVYKTKNQQPDTVKYPVYGYPAFPGAKVEIDGIVSPSDDQTEANIKPSCTTDSTGKFIIVLPERYSIKETVTITISQGSKKQSFIKSASEVINAVCEQKVLDKFYELDSLGDDIDFVRTKLYTYQLSLKKLGLPDDYYCPQDLKDSDDEEPVMDSQSADEIICNLTESQKKTLAEIKEALLGDSKKEDAGLYHQLESLNKQYIVLLNSILKAPECKPKRDSVQQALNNFIKNVTEVESVLEGANYDVDNKDEGFVVIKEVFEDADLYVEKAMPKVKLMGNDDDTIRLSTDTAPSRIHSYCMLQRLVEPDITSGGRKALTSPIDVMNFRKNMAENPNLYPQASSLGMGYVLNMHQAWVPDGFALGDLLYSLILAPGEEQRLVVRENKQSYTITDEADATDLTSENYELEQNDDTNAAYDYAVKQLSTGNSSYKYSAKTGSIGASLGIGGVSNGVAAMFGLSGGYSKSSGSGSSSARQSNSHNEASSTAQSFQHSIKSASDKISQAKRVSMEMATSEQTDSVATKIIANHNHSHAMTVQYWEVMRRYKLQTCIDSVDLVLFIPLRLIRFLPQTGGALMLDNVTPESFTKTFFNKRYDTVLRYADIIRSVLPYKHRTGLDLIRQYAAIPKWKLEDADVSQKSYTLTFKANFLSFDDISVTMVLKNGKGTVAGSLSYVRKELQTTEGHNYSTTRELKMAIKDARNKVGTSVCTCTFILPANVTADDISYIKVLHSYEDLDYTLYADFSKLSDAEAKAYDKWQEKLYDLAKDNNHSGGDRKKIAHYSSQLPEAFTLPNITITRRELRALGVLTISDVNISTSTVKNSNTSGNSSTDNIAASLSDSTLDPTAIISIQTSYRTLRYNEFQKMESTLQHIVTNPMEYSKAVWSSLSEDERVVMLEQYTIDMNFELLDNSGLGMKNSEDIIPLLNCVNVKNLLGFYGNCMILPFTFPQRLANKLNKTAGDIQNELYRYHTNSFRVPTTTISLPTRGMIGEAVLGETNVSEEIDLTRFWNWQDSPIDKMEIDSSYLNGNDYLEGKSTKDVTALNMQGATAATPVTVPDLVSALVNKQSPTFDNITGLDQLKEILNAGTNSAATGRDHAISTSADVAKAALSAVTAQIQADKQKPSQDNGDGDNGGGQTPVQPGGSDGQSPVQQGGSDGQTPVQQGGGDGQAPVQQGGSDGQAPVQQGGSDSQAPVQPGSDGEEPIQPGFDGLICGGDPNCDGGSVVVPEKPKREFIHEDSCYMEFEGNVSYDIPVFLQPTMNSCWATSLFILLNFLRKTNIPLRNIENQDRKTLVDDMKSVLGSCKITNFLKENPIYFYPGEKIFENFRANSYLELFQRDLGRHSECESKKGTTLPQLYKRQGLKGENVDHVGRLPYVYYVELFTSNFRLQTEGFSDQNLKLDSIMEKLKKHGPLIVTYDSDDVAGDDHYAGHCVVVLGAYKNMEGDKVTGEYVVIFDPFPKFDGNDMKTYEGNQETIPLATFKERCIQHKEHIQSNAPIGWVYDAKVYE